MAKRTFENLEWREVVWQRPFEQEQVHELFAHLAVLSPRGPVIWTSRSHGGHVQHYIGADSRYISKIVNTIKVHGNIRIYPVGDHIFAQVNTVRQLTVSHPGLSLNTDVTSATMPARRARLIYVHPEIFGSPIGLHLFRMRRIEFMDNPLSVAPDAKVFTEQPLHWLDEDFVISPEYRSYQQEIQANERAVNKTKVYSPDYEAVRKACDPYLDKIRQSDLSQILAAYKRDNVTVQIPRKKVSSKRRRFPS